MVIFSVVTSQIYHERKIERKLVFSVGAKIQGLSDSDLT